METIQFPRQLRTYLNTCLSLREDKTLLMIATPIGLANFMAKWFEQRDQMTVDIDCFKGCRIAEKLTKISTTHIYSITFDKVEGKLPRNRFYISQSQLKGVMCGT